MQRYNPRRRRPPKDDSAIYGRSNELSELQVEAERSLRGEFPTPAAGRLLHASSTLTSDGSIRHKAFRLGNAEPPSVTLLKELFGPAVVVTTFALCLSFCRVRLSLDSVALGLVTFLVANRVLSTPESHNDLNGRLQIRPTLPRLLLEWVTISALVAFLTSALRFAHLFPRAALVTWFVVTPAALLASNYSAIHLTR
jgi:hypothetical protein